MTDCRTSSMKISDKKAAVQKCAAAFSYVRKSFLCGVALKYHHVEYQQGDQHTEVDKREYEYVSA